MLEDEDMKPRIGTPAQDNSRGKSPLTAVVQAWEVLRSGGAVVSVAPGDISLEKKK